MSQENQTLEQLLSMELGTFIELPRVDCTIMRVPGGWVYKFYSPHGGSCTFVPEPIKEEIHGITEVKGFGSIYDTDEPEFKPEDLQIGTDLNNWEQKLDSELAECLPNGLSAYFFTEMRDLMTECGYDEPYAESLMTLREVIEAMEMKMSPHLRLKLGLF